MKILIIRHGEPHYPTDTLTEKGKIEVELLSNRLLKEKISEIYVSPLKRARLTAEPTAEKLCKRPIVLEWLKEFPSMLSWEYETDYYKNMHSPWNMPPELWANDAAVFENSDWKKSKILENSKVVETYELVCDKFNELMASHGLIKDGNQWIISDSYRDDTVIALFCHFGLGTALIAHMLNMPLIPIWNSIFLPTSSVTTIYMEQHIKSRPILHGIFCGIGDTSHLYAGNEPISCAGLHTDSLK